jgi:AcrR family transcriptional regulator
MSSGRDLPGTPASSGPDDEGLLRALGPLFGERGFHKVTPGELEAATGLSYTDLLARVGDKETLFYLTLEYHARLAEAGSPQADTAVLDSLRAILRAIERANVTVKLRSIHHDARTKLQALHEASPQPPVSGTR